MHFSFASITTFQTSCIIHVPKSKLQSQWIYRHGVATQSCMGGNKKAIYLKFKKLKIFVISNGRQQPPTFNFLVFSSITIHYRSKVVHSHHLKCKSYIANCKNSIFLKILPRWLKNKISKLFRPPFINGRPQNSVSVFWRKKRH